MQVGDTFYHYGIREVAKWKIDSISVIHVIVIGEGGNPVTVSLGSWGALVRECTMVAHKDLVETYGEEAVFEHTLSGTVKDLLSTYKELSNRL